MTKAARYCLLALLVLAIPDGGQSADRVGNEQGARNSADFRIDVRPRVIAAGEAAVLHWSIKHATKVLIEATTKSSPALRKVGSFDSIGSLQVQPSEDTTYVFSCEGSTTYSCASVSVRVRVKRR
jgi:hypothetical protein